MKTAEEKRLAVERARKEEAQKQQAAAEEKRLAYEEEAEKDRLANQAARLLKLQTRKKRAQPVAEWPQMRRQNRSLPEQAQGWQGGEAKD